MCGSPCTVLILEYVSRFSGPVTVLYSNYPAFLRTPVSEPLLSLIVSTTLREKPLKITPERKAIAELLDSAGGGLSTGEVAPVAMNGVDDTVDPEDEFQGLEEVNIFDGLSQGKSCSVYRVQNSHLTLRNYFWRPW